MTAARDYSRLRSLLARFLDGDNSRVLLHELEGELADLFYDEDDTPGERLLHSMALYRPGGGPYLLGDEEMSGDVRRFLVWLDRNFAP
ncbi:MULTISPECIES: hypothetical protein [unclassified Lysobacter]|uniref:hypothetical protein n=1 Tax=unclassified Lysobacter TaxID=2635362 RepID=UPI001BECA78A|nr:MULTISPECIES: hypothetical protein [unclassified Lysobacter]MBT2747302.1 hypothetical protein [Lysobacter sp. ISL-42]MBT2753347.1 hypothetical protein [Lysobacter sp. ISL-50]MBT2775457.1 hypothetical protein [Lysobacter sp. ISL-54]MBT2783007.1 hypothetical protein [Lysobacter sp. ISL-52]